MTDQRQTGPERAFPSAAIDDRYGGMTLWDYYAGQALIGLLSHASGEDPEKAPRVACKLADEMMAERAAHKHNAPTITLEQPYDYRIFVNGVYTTTVHNCDSYELMRTKALDEPEPAIVELRRSVCGSTQSQPVLYRSPGHFWETS